VRQYGARQLDRRDQVGRDLRLDLRVGELLRGPERPVPGVRHDQVDPPELGERAVDDGTQLRYVGDVELGGPQLFAVLVRELGEALGLARGGGDAIAGRIAAEARANKQAIYAYFGSKDGLFDAMLAVRMSTLADAAPFTPDDLPAYAGALFEALQGNPDILRLTQWAWLERADVTPAEIESHESKAKAIAAASPAALTETRAMDIFILVVSLCTAWTTTAPALRAAGAADPAARQAAHRAAVVAATTAVVETLSAD
jgi:AcrR family transcriptional regulator